MTARRKATERAEAIARLREWLKPGDTVYTVLRHVSKSGMSRVIGVVVPQIGGTSIESVPPGGKPTDYVRKDSITIDCLHPNHAVAAAIGARLHPKLDGITIGGCGMDMGFHLVYELSSVLFGHLQCDRCGAYAHDGSLADQRHEDCGEPHRGTWRGGYPCLGKGKCPSNYHNNHRDMIRCEGVLISRTEENGSEYRHCYAPSSWGRHEIPADWPRRQIDIGEGQTIDGPYLACLSGSGEDGKPYEICPVCEGKGEIPNPEGPERWDLVHTDGYALRQRWL